MKGIVYSDFGVPKNVLKIAEVEKPVLGDDEVMIKVRASSLNNADYKRFIEPVLGQEVTTATRNLDENILKAIHKVLGMDASGVVEQVGKNVKKVKIGDEVFGITTNMLGAWAEYACLKENEVFLKPENLTFVESATLPVACTVALGAVRLADIRAGQNVLVNGATGGVGLFALQILKAFGANVTVVCSTNNVEMVRSFGADNVIDYKKENFTKTDMKYDCVLAVNGYQTLEEYKNVLNDKGVYIPVGGSQQCIEASQNGKTVFNDSSKLLKIMTIFSINREFPYIKELAESGAISPVVDNIFSIHEISNAIEDIVTNHAKGKVALDVVF